MVVVVVGWFLMVKDDPVALSTPTPTPIPTPTISPSPELSPTPTPVVSKNIITLTDSGYSPATITIKKGETVVWKNESKGLMWTASAMHPTHKVYPGTDITACGTQTLLPMFDACAGVASGQSWSFIFKNVGTWKYHNHLNSKQFGTVVVE